MARSSRKTTFDLDLKMFALAKDKELLNSAALMICQKCIEFTAELMTFRSVKENKQDYFAFRFAKKDVDKYAYKGSFDNVLRENPSDFLCLWKETLDECGKILGNDGVVFCMFMINDSIAGSKPVAYYSSPDGVGRATSSTLEAAWGRHFVKPLSNPVYLIGKELVPYELYHTPDANNIDYSQCYDREERWELFDETMTAAKTRAERSEKKKIEMLKTADPRKRQGYYLVTDKTAEGIPFGKKKLEAATPQPKETPKSSQNQYSQQECFDIAVAYIKKHLDNPGSLKIHSSRVKDGGSSYTFSIDYSVQSKFGEHKRETYYILVKAVSGSIDAVWSH